MPTMDELLQSIEIEREQAMKRRDRAVAEVKTILARAKNEGRATLTDDEDIDVKAAFDRRDQAKRELEGLERKLQTARMAKEAEDEVDDRLNERSGDPKAQRGALPNYDGVARVGREERTYNPQKSRKGGAFVRDVALAYLYRDLEAEDRLSRHMKEERVERAGTKWEQRAVGTGAFAGLTVPQYLTELFAPATAALRPFADICNQHDLPENGMTVNISRITTASGVALQATENTAVQNTDMDDTLLTENVQTAAGQQTISRQAIDRGTGVEDIVIDDLFRRYATALDATLLNQATTGLSAQATAIAYTDASPTAAEFWPKLLQGASAAESAFLGLAQPDAVVMHSRRWYWMQSQLTSTWPAFGQPGLGGQVLGENLARRYGSGARGVLPNGMVAIVDNNIATNLGAGTNEDEAYVVATDECHLWEDPNAPVFIRAEQPAAASLGVLLVLYGYFAYSFRRFTGGFSKIGGTGLITPVF